MITDEQCLNAMKVYYAKAKLQGTQRNDNGVLECWRAALSEAFQWRPIEDAPKDGTTVVLIDKKDIVQYPILASWRQKFDANATWRGQDGFEIINATHFFSLPPIS